MNTNPENPEIDIAIIETELQEIVTNLTIKALKEKQILMSLKNFLVKNCLYKDASNLLEIERKLYPERSEAIAAQELGRRLITAYGMSGVGVSPKTAWVLNETSKAIAEHGGNFDISHSSSIQALAEEYFGKD